MFRMTTWIVLTVLPPLALGQAPPNDKPSAPAVALTISAADVLRTRIPDIQFEEAPLADVLTYLGQAAGVNIVARWRHLEDLGVERDRPVMLSAKNLRLRQVLWLLMNDVGGPDVKLAYRAEGSLILFSTAEDLNQTMVVKAYDVQDLIAARLKNAAFTQTRGRDVPITVVPTVAAGAVAVQPVTRRYGSGVHIGGTEPDADYESQNEMDGTPEEHMRQLIDVITNTIEPDSWAVNGGTGTIAPFRGMLIVRNTPLVHQKLNGPIAAQTTP